MKGPIRHEISIVPVDQAMAEHLLKLRAGQLDGWKPFTFELPYQVQRGEVTYGLKDIAEMVVTTEDEAEKQGFGSFGSRCDCCAQKVH